MHFDQFNTQSVKLYILFEMFCLKIFTT
uniref:Uncharacterized protein n=1 Tax=Anguilla anguilla TaxID=7936 RepID=A0A0E9RK73_ANGAN